MSSSQQATETASNDVGCGKPTKTNKTRRSWTPREEDVLLAALKELVVQGWKSDNGFRAGYLGKLEEAVKSRFPNSNLKGMPHIHSKIAAWKRNYYSLDLMLSNTGVGFNVDGTHMIDVNNEQWDQIVNKDPNACLMRFKSWPHLDAWKEIFGKDRATGGSAEDLLDAINDMQRADNLENNGDQGDYHVHLEEQAENDGAADSVCQGEKEQGIARGAGRKRKASGDGLDVLVDVFSEMGRNADKRVDCIASRMGYEFNLGEARKEVFNQLNAMTTLSMGQKFDAYQMLAGEKQGLELFMGLPEEAKPQYVLHILTTKTS
ncbi:uncharacterized protein LOC130989428 [Salvia miltiorrhiza]|uniref:uncharacterized protein LOC130989428 n=1 Tax=Salvia miltiorrhiza TaxID=226208 RepID=UPI0025ABAC8A|nr:uncharacterized protein LOC130989428 [Salvia miltiorrhiza]